MLRTYVVSLMAGLAVSFAIPGMPVRAQETTAGAPAAGTCGNRLLDADESCDQCSADCVAQPCRPAKSRTRVVIDFVPPEAPDITSAVLRIGYRTDKMVLPSTGGDKAVRARIKGATDFAMLVPNDLDYALRVVVGRSTAMAAGKLLTIEFDRCQGAPSPAVGDLSCVVEACASSSGPQDCSCKIAAVKG
jgi:hypothetical protein